MKSLNLKDKSPEEIAKILGDAWLNIVVDENTLFNPLAEIPEECRDKPQLYFTWLMSQPEYISFICSELLKVQLLPFQCVILQELWKRKFPMLIMTRGGSKSFLLAVYTILRALLLPGRKIVVAGAGFRQSKIIYEYVAQIWNNAPLLRDAVGTNGNNGPKGGVDAVYFHINESKATFIPVGTGETIRGLRSNDTITDEFKSHNQEIFENVISGFGAVSSAPHEKVIAESAKKLSIDYGLEFLEPSDKHISNQIVISGTAYYHFNHFAKYHDKWRKIILSQGDPEKLKEVFPDGPPEDMDWRDYSVIRIPYNKLPPGFMDSGNIARSKATLNSSLFNMEFAAVFSKDSDGFFKATLLESATAKHNRKIVKPSGEIAFYPRIEGDPNLVYYMGIDTASQIDNFAITIVEVHPDHRRIVYCWTTNAKEFKEKRIGGETSETDFFKYCCKKIRYLMTRFNIQKISIDSQGGGRVIYEGLHDKGSLEPGEQMLWEIIEDTKKDCDAEEGLHIIELVNFAKQDYMSNSNHGMKKDFEDKNLLFPDCNPALLAIYASNINDPYFIEMDDCLADLDELKNEVTKIVVTTTANGRERFDTPETKISGSEKGRDRKDRYSALLMANMAARTDYAINNNYSMRSIESISQQSMNRTDVDFIGPAWLTSKLNGLYDD